MLDANNSAFGKDVKERKRLVRLLGLGLMPWLQLHFKVSSRMVTLASYIFYPIILCYTPSSLAVSDPKSGDVKLI